MGAMGFLIVFAVAAGAIVAGPTGGIIAGLLATVIAIYPHIKRRKHV
jgi:hypothetical protein